MMGAKRSRRWGRCRLGQTMRSERRSERTVYLRTTILTRALPMMETLCFELGIVSRKGK